MPCPLCEDTGWKPIDENGVRSVIRCDCWIEGVARRRLAAAQIPRRYHHCTLKNFDVYNDSLKRVLAYANRVVAEFPLFERGMLLMGQPGVGKTHLAVAILKQAIQKGASGYFFTTSDLMNLLRSTYSDDEPLSESTVLRRVNTADVLLLDELGRDRCTEWRDEMLHTIVNTRYSQRRMTIFTTNFDIGEIDDPNSLQCRTGVRVFSRLTEMCEIINIDGADYRDRPSNATHEDLVTMWKMRKKSSSSLPARTGRQARAQLRDPQVRDGRADLKWPGGRAGS